MTSNISLDSEEINLGYNLLNSPFYSVSQDHDCTDLSEQEYDSTANSGWDKTLFDLSSTFTEPFCWISNLASRVIAPLGDKFTNCTNSIQEIATRCLIVTGGILATGLAVALPLSVIGAISALGVTAKLLRAAAIHFQKNGYTHLRGAAPEKTLVEAPKLMTWNICASGGGIPQAVGGVVDWRAYQEDGDNSGTRIERIIREIEKEDADVVVLQEVYDGAVSKEIFERLSNRYAHFYTHIGPNSNLIGSESGVMVFTKCAVHSFNSTQFENRTWELDRIFATIEIKKSPQDTQPFLRLIGTHLLHTDDEAGQIARKEQLDQIREQIKENEKRDHCPTVLMGDLNMQRGEEGASLDAFLTHAYLGNDPTCTNLLVKEWNPDKKCWNHETIDYISLFTETGPFVTFSDVHLVNAYDEEINTRTAISDHNAIVATIQIAKDPEIQPL